MRRRPGGAIGAAPSNGSPEACASRCRTVEPGGPAGSSRSTTPSSAATSVARALTGFETDASRTARRVSPRVAIVAVRAGHAGRGERHVPAVDLAQSLQRAGDTTRAMERRLISGHSPFEPVAGFSRAVVVGSTVHVAGTAPIPPDGSPTPESAYEQARLCLAIIAEALERAGSSVDDVVRTRMFVTDRRALGGRLARARRGLRRDEARRDLRRHRRCSTRPGRSRSRPRR